MRSMPSHGSLRRRRSLAGTSRIVNASGLDSLPSWPQAIGIATGAPGRARSD